MTVPLTVTDELLGNNAAYAETFPGLVPVVPARRVAVVTCMDSRVDVFGMLGLQIGEAHIIRNAGGVITDDVIRSLAVSQRLLNTNVVIVIHHTECGLDGLDEEAFIAGLVADAGAPPAWPVRAFDDLDADVRASVEAVRSSAYLPHRDQVRGFVVEVATGRLREV
jgi:carbonic anhydrase